MLKKILFLLLGILIVSCEKETIDIYDTLEIETIDESDEISRLFSETEMEVHVSTPFTIRENTQLLKNEDGFSQYYDGTLAHVHGNIQYTFDNEEYLFVSPAGDPPERGTGIEVGPLLYKRIKNKWVFIKSFNDVNLYMVRNYDMSEDGSHFVLGDAPEYTWLPSPPPGKGVGIPSNIYIGKILKDDIEFTLVNPDKKVWAHDVSIGDINNDGLLDVASAGDGTRLYFQKSDGTFEIDESKVEQNWNWFHPFAIDFIDVDDDSILEFVVSSYNMPSDETKYHNDLQVYKMDSDGIFKRTFHSENPNEFIQGIAGAGMIRTSDMDNDGLTDVVIRREGYGINIFNPTEIWKNNGDGTFSRLDIFGNSSVEENGHYGFEIIDINNDGFNDIALVGFHWGSELRINPPRDDEGFILNNLIHLNNGDGTFSKYNGKDLSGGEGFQIEIFYPIKINGKFRYIGKSSVPSPDGIISKLFEINFDL